MEISSSKALPENAYRPLKPGETYEPIVPAGSTLQEFTPRSLTMGLVMAAVFSAAAAFLGLKVGQVFEAAIPIAILAVGMLPVRAGTIRLRSQANSLQKSLNDCRAAAEACSIAAASVVAIHDQVGQRSNDRLPHRGGVDDGIQLVKVSVPEELIERAKACDDKRVAVMAEMKQTNYDGQPGVKFVFISAKQAA